MALIDWIPTHNTGIPEIDSENQQLVGIINKLHDSITKPDVQQIVISCVHMLAHNFKNHCQVIESLCQKIAYPDSARIFNSHDKYGKTLAGYLRKIHSKEKISAQALIGFLREWYNSHVLDEDQQLKKYLYYINKQMSKPKEFTESEKFVHWKDSYNINNEVIDSQHLKIVELINTLHTAIINKKTNGIIIKIVKELIAYTGYHFKEEEQLMHSSGYPKTDGHIEQHRKIIKDIEEIVSKLQKKDQYTPYHLLEFLKTWLMDHILKDDVKIGEYLNQKETVTS